MAFHLGSTVILVVEPDRARLEPGLEPGREVLVAGDGEEVARILRELTPERARRIGERARRRVLGEHTYDLRAAQVEARLLRALAWKARKTA